VIDYFAKSVETAERLTHILPASRNEMLEKMLRGVYKDYSDEAWFTGDARPLVTEQQSRENRRAGQEDPRLDHASPFTRLEQHCWLDLDGDGYAEPYIVTIEADTKKVLRIVARWNQEEDIERTAKGRIMRINPEHYFTKYTLIPSPDGGIYDLGFGVLLGPLNESVNSLVNQLIDAGTWATTAGGFLGRGAKIRGGTYSFAPLEWKRVDATGDDLQKSIFPLPVREPSAVLFQLLGLLINYTERISGATDMLVGENPGQNTPAETSRAMVEQGMKIYTAIFKRVWRSMKWEFKKLFVLNGRFMPLQATYGAEGKTALREDYLGDPGRICPAADPNMVSDSQRMQQAVTLKEAARMTPGYDVAAVERHFLKALKVENIDQLYPGPDKLPQGESEKITIQKMKMQETQLKLQAEQMRFVAELMEEQRVNSAEIVRLQAEAAKLTAEAADVGATTQVTALQAMVSAAEARQQSAMQRIEQVLRSVELAQGWKELALKDKEIEVKKNEPAASKS
jgi:chaperonin GroES